MLDNLLCDGFNPTMVRLLLALQSPARGHPRMFQSHNGAIAALKCPKCKQWFACFNPTMVRLLLFVSTESSPVLVRFNPTMVRLLHGYSSSVLHNNTVSIPQWCDCCQKWLQVFQYASVFQSHNGAIAARRNAKKCPIIFVSIPQWCDCCKSGARWGGHRVEVSIPQWCDCCSEPSDANATEPLVSIPQWCDCCCNFR